MTVLLDTLQRRLGQALFARVAGPEGPANRARLNAPGPAVVRCRPPDPAGTRRRRDVRRRPSRAAAAVAAPAGHDRGRAALRLPQRPVGPAAADKHLPRGHHVRHRRRRAARRRPCAPGPPARQGEEATACGTGRTTRTCCAGSTLRKPTASSAATSATAPGRSMRPGATATSPTPPASRSPSECPTRADAAGARRGARLLPTRVRASRKPSKRPASWWDPAAAAAGPRPLCAAGGDGGSRAASVARRELRLPSPHFAESALVPRPAMASSARSAGP